MNAPKTITLAYTGASGMPYGVRLLELLLASGNRVYLLYSQPAQMVAHQEMQLVLPSRAKDAEELFNRRFNAAEGQLRVFGRDDWFAPVASGSNAPRRHGSVSLHNGDTGGHCDRVESEAYRACCGRHA